MRTFVFAALFVLLALSSSVDAGPLSYGICQTGCNGLAVACYSAAGAVMGVATAGVAVPAAVLACNAALGTCMVGCIAAGCTPIP